LSEDSRLGAGCSAFSSRDPLAFIESLRPLVIFDEIQITPQLLHYVRTLVDARPPAPVWHC